MSDLLPEFSDLNEAAAIYQWMTLTAESVRTRLADVNRTFLLATVEERRSLVAFLSLANDTLAYLPGRREADWDGMIGPLATLIDDLCRFRYGPEYPVPDVDVAAHAKQLIGRPLTLAAEARVADAVAKVRDARLAAARSRPGTVPVPDTGAAL